MKTQLLAGACLYALLFPFASAADAQTQSQRPLVGGHGNDVHAFIAQHDADGDGTVSRAEFDAARDAQFARTDANGDGALSEDEYLAEYEDRLDRRIATLVSGSDRQTRVRFEALDTDGDGRMTFAEYQVSGKRIFDAADRNKDGVVDAVDATLPAPPRRRRPSDAGTAGN